MPAGLHTTLGATLAPHFDLGKTRLATLAIMIIGLANGRTVNLSHIASQFPGAAKHASNYRRLQRFFQYVRLEQDRVAPIVVRMLNLSRPKLLALDRTNWKVGGKDINILTLAIVTRRFRVPLMWTLLEHRGNSNTKQRIALMRRYLALFDASSIKLLLADREFIGAQWMDFLNKNNIPFAIRIKAGLRFKPDSGGTWSISTLLRKKRARRRALIWKGRLPDADMPLAIAAKRVKSGAWMIIATNTNTPQQALNAYRKRWAIECLFADTKTRGLNIEDTHITDPLKISTLLTIITLAITWAYRCATQTMGRAAIRRKTHGRRQKSWFRTGLDTLRNWIINQPQKAEQAWLSTCPKYLNTS